MILNLLFGLKFAPHPNSHSPCHPPPPTSDRTNEVGISTLLILDITKGDQDHLTLFKSIPV